jgi:hypothetical protein
MTDIIKCELKFMCEKTWESLAETNERDIKFCDFCLEKVYYCHTKSDFIEAASKNLCVAYNSEDIPVQLLTTSTEHIDSKIPVIRIDSIRLGIPSTKKTNR